MAEATRMEAPAWVPHPAVTHTAAVVPVSVLLLVATPTVVAVAMEDHPQVTVAPLPKGITERRHQAVMVAEEVMALLLRATMVLLPLKEATAEAMALLLKAIMALHPLKEATANPKQSIERRPAAEPTRKPCSLASTTCVINVVA